jgi:hypothetical protein
MHVGGLAFVAFGDHRRYFGSELTLLCYCCLVAWFQCLTQLTTSIAPTSLSFLHRRFSAIQNNMTSTKVLALRHIVSGAAPYLRATQRRWAQVHDVRFLATQQSDRVLEKYKGKLAQKARE